MTLPSIIIKDILVAASIGVFGSENSAEWGIHIGKQIDSTDKNITIYDTGGQAPHPRWLLDYPSIQIVVRGNENGYQATYNKAQDIQKALLGYPSTDIGSDRLVYVLQTGNTAFIGYDPKNRPEFSLNFGLCIEPGTVGSYREPLGG